jgi:hypothetical protein
VAHGGALIEHRHAVQLGCVVFERVLPGRIDPTNGDHNGFNESGVIAEASHLALERAA